jgi:hypothetical protein
MRRRRRKFNLTSQTIKYRIKEKGERERERRSINVILIGLVI